MKQHIDIHFRSIDDTPINKDPDLHSKKLNAYHTYLWSKPLPSGDIFHLKSNDVSPYKLMYQSLEGILELSSDCICHTYSKTKRMKEIVSTANQEAIAKCLDLGRSIGGYLIFPSTRMDNQATINVMRGFHPLILDRIDLTLECIRRWYVHIESPLYKHLERYRSFFELFVDFKTYINFFLLNDFIDEQTGEVLFLIPFNDFKKTKALPSNEEEYREYISQLTHAIQKRNERIINYTRI